MVAGNLRLAQRFVCDALLLCHGAVEPQGNVVFFSEVEEITEAHSGADHLINVEVGLAFVQGLDRLVVVQKVRHVVRTNAHIFALEPMASWQQDIGIQGRVAHGHLLDNQKLYLLQRFDGFVLLGLVRNNVGARAVQAL